MCRYPWATSDVLDRCRHASLTVVVGILRVISHGSSVGGSDVVAAGQGVSVLRLCHGGGVACIVLLLVTRMRHRVVRGVLSMHSDRTEVERDEKIVE